MKRRVRHSRSWEETSSTLALTTLTVFDTSNACIVRRTSALAEVGVGIEIGINALTARSCSLRMASGSLLTDLVWQDGRREAS